MAKCGKKYAIAPRYRVIIWRNVVKKYAIAPDYISDSNNMVA